MEFIFVVVDCPFNRAHYPDLIGQKYITPPSFAVVKPYTREAYDAAAALLNPAAASEAAA